eukprot:TRINITY_DN3513_c0_g1_i4.p1 TRINITY_DN3513_c0_g1~~TRINITY_DN3513_c0_g1_i4.p1  ORF type:complete len:391 (+),score=64.90 TRINITY_DN3513_c0_g1_i4:45-1175(+)
MSDTTTEDRSLWVGKDVLITGGGGYFGMRLCNKLLSLGVKKVRIFDLRRPDAALSAIKKPDSDRVEFIGGDIRDYSVVKKAVTGTDVVFHVASFGMSGGDMLKEPLVHAINVGGTESVIKAVLETGSDGSNPCTTLVFTSSCNVVFDGVTPLLGVDESYPYPPISSYMDAYSKTKRLAEELVVGANGKSVGGPGSSHKLASCSLRSAGIYGEGEQRHFTRVLKALRQGVCLFTFGDPKSLVEWVYIDNLVYAHLLAAEKLMKSGSTGVVGGKCYFISDWEPVNQWEFFRPMIEGLGYKYPTLQLPEKLLFTIARVCELVYHSPIGKIFPHEPFMTRMEVAKIACPHYFSTERASKELGYKPLVTMKEGLVDLTRRV